MNWTVYGSFAYAVVEGSETHSNARTVCDMNNATLASVMSEDENRFVTGHTLYLTVT